MKERRRSRVDQGAETDAAGEKRSVASRTIFALLLIIPAVATILFGAVDSATWALIYAGAALLLVLWFWDAWTSRAITFNANALLIPLAGLIAIGLIQIVPLFPSTVPADIFPDAARASISLEPFSTRMFVGRLAVYTFFLDAALTYLTGKSRIKKAVIFTIAFASLMAMFAILQRLANFESIYGLRGTPGAIFFGPFVNQHHFAAFMEMAGGLVFGFLFAPGTKQQMRIVLATAATVMGVAVVMTSSRGGLISFVGTLLFAIAINVFGRAEKRKAEVNDGRGQKLGAVSLAGGLLVVIVGTVLFLGADSSFVRGIELVSSADVTNGRTHFWAIALRIFADHPLLGTGLDAFGSAFTRYDTWPGIFRIEQAHNDYIQTLADAGLAGLACVAAFIYLLFKKGIAAITNGRTGQRRSAAIGALCGCFGILVHSFFDFPLRTPSNAFFFLLLATIAISSAGARNRSSDLD